MLNFCKKHGETEHVVEGRGDVKYNRCKKCRTEYVQRRRKKVKLLLLEYKGGKCEICDYSKCAGALEFHHTNPEEKEFSISKKGETRSLERMKKEADKCQLLCCRCHRELHAEKD